MSNFPNSTWWAPYQWRLRFKDGGREGDLVDCYGMARQIYKNELAIDLACHPLWTLDAATFQERSFLEPLFTSDFRGIEQGFEQAFDTAVIRRAIPVNNKLKRGWWHVGVITREGHVLHIDYHQGVVEVPFRDTTLARANGVLRAEDVRIFRHRSKMAVAA